LESKNSDVVRRAWEGAFNSRNGAAFVKMHSDEITYYDPTLPKPIRGKVELENWFDSLFMMFPDCKMEISKEYTLGDWVCAECVESGTMKGPIKHQAGEVAATGKSYKIGNVLVCRLEGGRIAEVRSFYNALDLMSQLGLNR
jgi:steroid delta-isomerase-like uncharacterized protein